MSVTVRTCLLLLVAGALLRFAAAIVDNDVLGLLKLSYQPHHLAARILAAVDYVISFPALVILVVLLVVWVIGRIV